MVMVKMVMVMFLMMMQTGSLRFGRRIASDDNVDNGRGDDLDDDQRMMAIDKSRGWMNQITGRYFFTSSFNFQKSPFHF